MDSMLPARGLVKPMPFLFQGSLYLTAVSQFFLFLLWGGEILLKDSQMGFRRVCIQKECLSLNQM